MPYLRCGSSEWVFPVGRSLHLSEYIRLCVYVYAWASVYVYVSGSASRGWGCRVTHEAFLVQAQRVTPRGQLRGALRKGDLQDQAAVTGAGSAAQGGGSSDRGKLRGLGSTLPACLPACLRPCGTKTNGNSSPRLRVLQSSSPLHLFTFSEMNFGKENRQLECARRIRKRCNAYSVLFECDINVDIPPCTRCRRPDDAG